MKSSTLSITFAAMLMVAAFVGVALVADDASAGEEAPSTEVAKYKVTYVYGESTVVEYTDATTEGKYTFKAPSSIGFESKTTGYKLEDDTWIDSASGTKYAVGTPYTFTKDVVVEPVSTLDSGYVAVTLTDGTLSKTFVYSSSSSTVGGQDGFEAFIKELGLKLADEGKNIVISDDLKDVFRFDGFFKDKVPEDKKTGAITTVANLANPSKGTAVTYVASFTPIYALDFYVDGVKITNIKSIEFTEAPMDPEKANYTFKGWAVDGEIVSVVEAGKIVITSDYVKALVEDTDFDAVFEPIQLTVTLVVGEYMHTQPALYEQTIAAPALPSGYAYWATMEVIDGVEVYTEFDFTQPIYEDLVLYAQAVDPSAIYNVTFEIEGKAAVIQKSDSIVIPNPSVDGKVFKGWVVKGESNYVDPAAFEYTSDVTFVAIYDKAPAPAGPGFFQTTAGQCTAVIIAVLIIAFVYAVYSNMFGMKDFLTSFKVQRVKKE